MPRSTESPQWVQEKKTIGSKEQQILEIIRGIEQPFMRSLKHVYPDQGWHMCGPASIALSRILSTRTDIPIRKGGLDEHIELEIGIYDPKNDPERAKKLEEQTYIRYYNGKGFVYYIDPIFGLLMEELPISSGAIKVEKYRIDEIDSRLQQKHEIYPFDPQHEGLELNGAFAQTASFSQYPIFMTPEKRLSTYQNYIAILHDERATMPVSLDDSGNSFFSESYKKTEEIINYFAPTWERDVKAMKKRLEEYHLKQLGPEKKRSSLQQSIANQDYLDMLCEPHTRLRDFLNH